MASEYHCRWWGTETCLDEEDTQRMLTALDVGGVAVSVAALFSSDPDSKIILGISGAFLKLGAVAIKSVDRSGGSNGVCVHALWLSPQYCWVKPREA